MKKYCLACLKNEVIISQSTYSKLTLVSYYQEYPHIQPVLDRHFLVKMVINMIKLHGESY